jgi:NAD-dependent SIR2 family protein deacetylase
MSDADYLKCSCQKCGEHIEFPASRSGDLIDCPHCGGPTTLVSIHGNIPVKSGRRVSIIIVLVLILVTSGVILYRSKMPKSAVLPQITVAQTVTNAAILETFTELNDLKISAITLKKRDSGGLVYAVGTVKNNTARQRFGVKIELDLLDDQNDKIGSTSDYIAVLEPQGEWKFKALLTEPKVVKAKLSNIEEQK